MPMLINPYRFGLAPGTTLLDIAQITFSRNNGTGGAGAGTGRGSISTVNDYAIDVMRVDTLASVSKYILESARNQYLLRTDIFGGAGWTASPGTYTPGTLDYTDPSGGNQALKAVFTASGTAQVIQQIAGGVIADGDILTLVVWAKCASGTEKARLAFTDRSNTTTNFPDQVVTTTWAPIVKTVNAGTGATNPTFRVRNASDAVVRTVYFALPFVTKRAYPMRHIRNGTSGTQARAADSASWGSSHVPAAFRDVGFSCGVRLNWASGDLTTGDKRVLFSTDANNWIGFEESGGSVYLRCYIGGALKFGTGALTIVADTDYTIKANLAAGVMTFNGVDGSAGTATSLPGGVSLRWGGTAGGSDELDGSADIPVSI